MISLWAEDVRLAAHFYRDVLGLNLVGHHGDGVHFDVSGTYLVIQPGSPCTPKGERRFPLFALGVENLDEYVLRLQQHGVELPWGVESGPASRWVMFHDPGGNLIELVEMEG